MKQKQLLIALGILVLLGILLISLNPGKTDDWQYSHSSGEQWVIYIGIFAGLLILGWLAVSIYLIAKGKGFDAKRKLGIWLIASPIVLLGLGFLLVISGLEFLLLAIPLIIIGLMIWGIVYSIIKRVWVALAPLLIIPGILLLIIIVGSFAYFGVLSPGAFTASTGQIATKSVSNMPTALDSASESLGYSVGGAKDINNFRENIENDYLPLPTDITYEGLFYDYYFDTGKTKECNELFCPSYSYAISKDPISNETDHYLSVGLNSGMKESDFKRKKLNLVIVLDISGSMGSSFRNYHYDNKRETSSKSKMKVASEAVVGLLDHLNEDDRFGMVLFDNTDYLGKPLRKTAKTDIAAIKDHILEIRARGGTNFEAGYKGGTELFDRFRNADSSEYENRIIFLTDAMPNRGVTSSEGLLGLTQKNAEDKIYTTFIGIGVDFNTELIEQITKIRGANYYSVHSADEFMERMDGQFKYMVTPLVFNLTLQLDADGYDIEKVYGSPEANEATGEIMKVNTLFPSKTEEGRTKGGIIVLKLDKQSEDANLELKASYEDRQGKVSDNSEAIEFPSKEPDYYENSGLRKGIILSRYADLMKNWIIDERESYQNDKPLEPTVNPETGIVVPGLGKWERQSVPLQVSGEYKDIISDFRDYFSKEAKAIGDNNLTQEIKIMNDLSG